MTVKRKQHPRAGKDNASPRVKDEKAGAPRFALYHHSLAECEAAMERGHSVGVIALRPVDSMNVEEYLGREAFHTLALKAFRRLEQRLPGLLKGWTWLAGMDDAEEGELLYLYAWKSGPPVPSSLDEDAEFFALVESLRGIALEKLSLAVGAHLLRPREGPSPRRRLLRAHQRSLTRAQLDELPELERQSHELRRIIYQKQVKMVFQPIVDLRTRKPAAWEALARGPESTAYESPEFLFALSRRSGLTLDLDVLCRNSAILQAPPMTNGSMLFVNVLAYTLSHRRFFDQRMEEVMGTTGLSPRQVVFEISEQYPISDYAEFRRNVQELRDMGFRLALDDVGVGYSSLRTLFELHPDFVKLDHSLVRFIDREPLHARVLNIFTDLSQELGAAVVAEGVETEEELSFIQSIGIPYAQGFFLGHPQPPGTA